MSNGVVYAVVIFLMLTIAGGVFAWWFSTRLKRGLDTRAAKISGGSQSFTVGPAVTAALRQLSAEPILIKQSTEGLRFQIEQRRMAPIAALSGTPAGLAVRSMATALTQSLGLQWVVIVRAVDDEHIRVERVA